MGKIDPGAHAVVLVVSIGWMPSFRLTEMMDDWAEK